MSSCIPAHQRILAQKQLLMIELSKADVPSSHLNAHEKLNSTQRDTGKLVINITAVMGNCNPKVLIDIMKAFTSYFDQNPGSYSITRALLIYIHAEFLSNNVTIAFPMQSNDYSLGDNAGFKALMAPYLERSPARSANSSGHQQVNKILRRSR
eukprot:SAG31_NODE_2857_length_4991_cov_51.196443_1_plen_153_part_00